LMNAQYSFTREKVYVEHRRSSAFIGVSRFLLA
jgi:hypothetical protein